VVVFWYNYRVEQKVIAFTLGRLDKIESLGYKKRFENLVELGANSYNPNEFFVRYSFNYI
jgi:hypothetical protein